MGNICRSPAGHCVLQHLVNQAEISQRFEIESAGTLGYHVGSPPDTRMQQAMKRRKIPIIGNAQKLQASDLAHYDLILAMDKDNLLGAKQLDPNGNYHEKIKLFSEYCTRHSTTEVPDPYYGGDQGFERVLDLIEDGCENILKQYRPSTN